MKNSVSKIPVLFAILEINIAIGAQQIPEAPAGFDGVTNGSVPQNVMDDAAKQFQEIEAPVPNGLGPVFNDVSCANCHQNQAVGGAAQVLEFQAGHNDSNRPQSFLEKKHRGTQTAVAERLSPQPLSPRMAHRFQTARLSTNARFALMRRNI
jgi:hypothetical protein